MIPSMASISPVSAAVRVDKATSDFLIEPDWALNMDICDMINSNNMLAKDVVKAVKKRLQHKNPKVQLLALTLLEMMVKNCGDYVHLQIAERDILPEMVKIVRKRGYQTDFQVTDKILTLIGAWSDALGGVSNGKYPQYHMAYQELRRSGLQFPQRSADSALIFTPPVVHSAPRYPQPGHGMPSSSSTRLDQAMAADTNISLFAINTMREALDLLADMLRAVDARDRSSVKDEVIVDLVDQCRSNQKKLMQCLETTGDEELLRQGLELNDNLQNVLAKHDAIASGTPLPPEIATETSKASEKHEAEPAQVNPPNETSENTSNSLPIVPVNPILTDDDEEEDEFSKLARRHSTAMKNESTSSGISNALVPMYPLEPVQSKDQYIMDLLSLTLTTPVTTSPNEQTFQAPPSNTNTHDSNHFSSPFDPRFSSDVTPGHPGFAFNNYVAPWAQPQMQPPPPPLPQLWKTHTPFQPQPQSFLPQVPSSQPQFQVQVEQQKPEHEFQTSSPTSYPPPPWAPTPGYFSNQTSISGQPLMTRPASDDRQPNSSPRSQTDQKPFVPSYKLFDDLDVFSTTGGRFKPTTNSILGSNNSMVGGRK